MRLTYAASRRAAALIVALCLGALTLVLFQTATPASAAACTISKDSSAPADVKLTNSTSSTATSASFSPPANTMVAVTVSVEYDSNNSHTPAVTVKDSKNTSYTAGPSAYDGSASGTYTFTHYYTTAPGSVTVKATRSGTGSTGASMFYLNTKVLLNAASTQTGAASASAHATSGTSLTHAVTPTVLNSWVLASVSLGSNQSATASGVTGDNSWQDVNDGSSTYNGHAVTSSLTAETIGWTVPNNTFWSWTALEILPATGCASAPTVTTNAASSVGTTTATLNGTVNPNGASTTYQFDYGTTTSYGTSVPVPAGSAGSGTTGVSENYPLTGLTASTTYHYRVEATNTQGTTFGADQQFTTTGSGFLLNWSPPDCGGTDGLTCTTINITNTNRAPTLASNVDYKLVLPSTPITAGTVTINGGHNVQIIGGEIDLVNPCSDSGTQCPSQANGAIYITDGNPGEVYIEGVLIKNNDLTQDTASSCPGGGVSCSTADGIDVNVGNGGNPASPPTIVMQNLRVDGVSGCSGGADHADVFQPYNAGTATVDIDHMTGTSNCQGMQIDPDYGFANFGTLPTYNIMNTNTDVLNNPYSGDGNRYMWWLTYNTACNSGNITLTGDYNQEPDGTMSVNSVWPDTNQPAACESVWSSPTLSFPNSPQITGSLTEGQPTGGDYVPASAVGIGYVSPGYK